MQGRAERTAFVRRVEGRVVTAALAANGIVFVCAATELLVGSLIYPGGVELGRFFVLLVGGVAVWALVVTLTCRHFVVRPTLRPAVAWVLEGRAPTVEEVAAVAAQPGRQVTRFLAYWIVGLVAFHPAVHSGIGYRPELAGTVKTFGLVALNAFLVTSLTFLFVEVATRPLLQRALKSASSVPKTMSVFPRLLLGWAIASGVPIASIALVVVALDRTQVGISVWIIYVIAATSIVVGITATLIGTRSFTEPLERLGEALGRVAAGDLSTTVDVSQAGEIGDLQAGFNDMLGALRDPRPAAPVPPVPTDDQHALDASGRTGRSELRDITAIFIDVVGPSVLTRTYSADEVVRRMNEFIDVVSSMIEAESGIVNKVDGESVLGVFGAPRPQADHASRALRAAREIGQRLPALAASTGLNGAVGVASGTVVAGNVGVADRFEYTVIGPPIIRAVSLCDEALHIPERALACETSLEIGSDEVARWEQPASVGVQLDGRPLLAGRPRA